MVVAIIDDGISVNVANNLIFSLQVDENGMIEEYTGYTDILSHGSICAAIIQKYNPYVKLGSIKILDTDTKRGDCSNLEKAIYWCINNGIKIINLSLGSVDVNDYPALLHAVNAAYNHGIIIVSACKNGCTTSYPASFSNVIGVRCDPALKGDWYYAREPNYGGIDFFASSSNELGILSGSPYNGMTSICNSFAAPVITTKVYSILVKHPQFVFDEIKHELNQISEIHIPSYKPYIYKRIDWVDRVDLLVVGDPPLNEINMQNWNVDQIICIDSNISLQNDISSDKTLAVYYSSSTIEMRAFKHLRNNCLFLNRIKDEEIKACTKRTFIPTQINDYDTKEIAVNDRPVVAIIQNIASSDYPLYAVLRDMFMQKGFNAQLFSEHVIDILVGAVFVNSIDQYKYNCIYMADQLRFDLFITHTTIESIVEIDGFQPDIVLCNAGDKKQIGEEIITEVNVIEIDNRNAAELFLMICDLVCE